MTKILRTIAKWFFIGVCIILFFWFAIYNVSEQKAAFWKASAVDCITIAVAVAISYYLVQRQNNRQKQKDIVSDLILKMQVLFDQKVLYDFSNQEKEDITMRTRDLNNKIHILETVKDEFSISDKVDFIRKRFDEYNTFIGDHIGDMEYLLLSQRELKRPVELISQKLLETALCLYK